MVRKMPAPRTPGEQPRADAVRNRERMLDAAALVLSTNASASLAEIADAAGLSRATAYRHFPDIEAIRTALREEAEMVGRDLLQEQLAPLFGPDAGDASTAEQMMQLFRIALPLEHRWTKTIANEPVPDGGMIQAFAPLCSAIIKRGQQRGDLREDINPELASEALIALALYAVRRLHSGGLDADQAVELVRPLVDGLRRSRR